jgi:hypothetical protein
MNGSVLETSFSLLDNSIKARTVYRQLTFKTAYTGRAKTGRREPKSFLGRFFSSMLVRFDDVHVVIIPRDLNMRQQPSLCKEQH